MVKDRLVGLRAEFYTVSGRMLKSATFNYDNRVVIDGQERAFVSQMVITDGVVPENVTTMSYSNAKLKHIPDSTFNMNLLLR